MDEAKKPSEADEVIDGDNAVGSDTLDQHSALLEAHALSQMIGTPSACKQAKWA